LYPRAVSPSPLDLALAAVPARAAEAVSLTKKLVLVNSFTGNSAGCNHVLAMLEEAFALPGLTPEVVTGGPSYGDHLVVRSDAACAEGARPVLLVGHHDTVFPPGVFEGWHETPDGRAVGPGALDMKGGLAVIRGALAALADAGVLAQVPACVVSVADEEVGSPSSMELLRRLSAQATCGLVFESGRANDVIITRRKGTGLLRVTMLGRAAHAGNDHARGINAIWALSRFVDAAQAMTDASRGITINVGVIKGGTTRNTVPERAECELDLRFERQADAEAVVAALGVAARHAASGIAGATVEVDGGVQRAPLERSEAQKALFEAYAACAKAAGLGHEEAPLIGGGSDASTLSAAGLPAIDGLGPRGAGFHTSEEWIELASFAPKIEALVRYLAAVPRG
jgi:glutamate carboxypeptidase